ncbi:MAG TPA: hypothetical protein VNE39_07055 [Planctomycetota bacterium]|nr:hypothetical protein [Planctomycetota bacterium]
MSTPRPIEGISIRALPLAVFALVLLVPFLNFEFTLYRSTLKLFVFQTATTLLWGYLLWEWAAGRLGRAAGAWPAWWLFVPVGAWVAWGLATAVWSPQGWLATGWVVQGAYGAAGALGLALLLRDAGHRRMFVAAGSAVAFALAFFMVLYYGEPRATFLGDIDHLPGREAGAAFLLLPTLVVAALLYRRAKDEGEAAAGYRGVIWLTVLLVVLLLAGVRTQVPAWRYGVGAGLLVLLWLLLPRWRLVAAVLALALALLAAEREMKQGLRAAEYWDDSGATRRAVLDAAEWRLVRQAPLARLLAGNGVGTLRLALDRERPVWTHAVSYGDEVVGHARRQLTEELFERGVAGVAIAVVLGLAWVVAGGLAFVRARDPFDSALGAGLAGAGVALGAFACFSNGAIGFGSGMIYWVGLGVLGALSVECGRPAGLSWSPEEEAWRGEGEPRLRRGRATAAAAAILAVALAWVALAARPFWAEYCLRDGQKEDDAAQRLFAQKRLAEQTLVHHRAAATRALAGLDGKLRAAEDALRAAAAAHDDALKGGGADAAAKALAAKRAAAAAALDRARSGALQARDNVASAIRQVEETLRGATDEYEQAARRTDGLLGRAARLSLGSRVWLDAEIGQALSDVARDKPEEAARRLDRLDALCGPVFDFDVQRAACHVMLGRRAEGKDAERARSQHFAQAHALYRRYAAKNPFGARCTLFSPRVPFYEGWHRLITDEMARKNPLAPAWAADFVAATSEGLRWLPRHYGLLLLRADVLYWLRRPEAARGDVEAASAIIEEAIANTDPRFALTRATLYFELANANLRWNRDKALKAANQVFLERTNPNDPQTKDVHRKVHRILTRLKQLMDKPPKPPDPKAPAPPKAEEEKPADEDTNGT